MNHQEELEVWVARDRLIWDGSDARSSDLTVSWGDLRLENGVWNYAIERSYAPMEISADLFSQVLSGEKRAAVLRLKYSRLVTML